MASRRGLSGLDGATPAVIRIPPHEYIHVLDTNSNVTAVLTGPKTYTRQDHERVTKGPESMVCVPPRHYCVIQDPVARDDDGNIVKDQYGMVRLAPPRFAATTSAPRRVRRPASPCIHQPPHPPVVCPACHLAHGSGEAPLR